jgi:hypothetical protein
MVLILRLVWGHLGPCWAALGPCWAALGFLGIHGATWGSHGPFLDTLMQYEGEHRQPCSAICEKKCSGRGGDQGGLVAQIGPVRSHLGPCWVALGTGVGIHWTTLGCHGPSLDTLMQHEGAQRPPYLKMCSKRPSNLNDVRGLGQDMKEVWRLVFRPMRGHLGPCCVALGTGLGIHWATRGCHGQSLGTWRHHGGKQKQPNVNMGKNPSNNTMSWRPQGVDGSPLVCQLFFWPGSGGVWRGGVHPSRFSRKEEWRIGCLEDGGGLVEPQLRI